MDFENENLAQKEKAREEKQRTKYFKTDKIQTIQLKKNYNKIMG